MKNLSNRSSKLFHFEVKFMEDKTAFVEVFGSSPLIRVIDFLITYREFDLPARAMVEKNS